ncbi:hypothetical protein DFH06DRAFT_471690 [Mycena polygramma]|nr:hypothetical protein DFH06DRAFT_471690 [Mycena polygramma]
MPKPTLGKSVRAAVLTCISGLTFAPPPLPFINDFRWPHCFNNLATDDDATRSLAAQQRGFYYQAGYATLNQALFLMVVDSLVDKPAGFLLALQTAICCNDVLKALINKIDPKLAENIEPTARMDIGFCQLIGVMWELEGRRSESVTRLLTPFLEPLLQAAGDTFIAFHSTAPTTRTKAKGTAKKAKNTLETETGSESQRENPPSSDQQFIANARAIQRALAQASPHLQQENEPETLCGLSPSAFQLRTPVAPRASIFLENLYDSPPRNTDLAAAGVRTIHRPRALLEAKQMLEKLLTERDGPQTPPSQAEVSAAMKELLMSIFELSPNAVAQSRDRSRRNIRTPRFSPQAQGHTARSSSVPAVPRTPEQGGCLEPGFELESGRLRPATPKNLNVGGPSGAAGSGYAGRRRPLTPNNGRQGEMGSL